MIVKKKLGQMLVDENMLTEEQLNKALADQEKAGLKLGQYLVRRGIITEQQIVDVLGRQLRLRKYHPDMFPFDVELSKVI
jgi:type IV pilus assembly protein PilB